MKRIFFSYAYDRDRLLVDRMQEAVRNQLGWDVIDIGTDEPSDEQFTRLRSLIQRSSLIISFYTGHGTNVLLETGLALGLGKQTLIAGNGPEMLPSALRSLPYLALSGDMELDTSLLVRRLESFQVEEERSFKTYWNPKEQLRTYVEDPAYFESLSPQDFEELISRLLVQHGFTVDRKNRPHDVGIDIVATQPRTGEVVAIQAKKSSRQSRVSMRDVMALLGAATLIKADSAALITSSSFTRASLEMAATTRVPQLHLVTVEDLLQHDIAQLIERRRVEPVSDP